jgi:hypothetical protein
MQLADYENLQEDDAGRLVKCIGREDWQNDRQGMLTSWEPTSGYLFVQFSGRPEKVHYCDVEFIS